MPQWAVQKQGEQNREESQSDDEVAKLVNGGEEAGEG